MSKRLPFHLLLKKVVGGSAGGKFEKTATLMRHHHNSYKRHNLAIILDPFSPTGNSQNNTANFMDDQEEPIFVPHHEKVSLSVIYRISF